MRMVSDIVDSQNLQKRIAEAKASHAFARQNGFMPDQCELAFLEYANGLPAEQFRVMLRAEIAASESKIALHADITASVSKAVGQEFDGESKGLMLRKALIGWEFETAERMAAASEPREVVPNARGNSLGLWREAILGNTHGALAFLRQMPGPRWGNPPENSALAEGVIRGDAKLVRAGLKATSAKFKKTWTLKTWCTVGRLKQHGTAAKIATSTFGHLIICHWLISDWAVAWMSLAWRRGLTGAFGEPEYFSAWVPWELCCPDPDPLAAASTVRKLPPPRRKSPGKLELRNELFAAATTGNVKVIQNLVLQGVQLDKLNQDRQTALMVAVHANHIPAVVALIKAGADTSVLDPKGRTLLGIAADAGMLEMVRTILSCGVKPDTADKPVSPLVRASRGGHIEIVHLLLGAGADPNRICPGHDAPLTEAIEKNHFEITKVLIQAGADVNMPVGDDCSALHYAIPTGDCDLLKFLLKAGADVNARNYWGANALHVAVMNGQEQAARLMIEAGVEVNMPLRHDGMTPLMLAAPFPGCIKLLLDAGADVSPRNKKKQTVLDLAQDYPESLKFLRARQGFESPAAKLATIKAASEKS